MSKRLLAFEDLRPKGVPFSKPHLFRLMRKGKFPKPVKLGEITNAWLEEEIDAWIAVRIAARDSVVVHPRDKKGRIAARAAASPAEAT
jgi:prophage regulatory protein